ncbi:MAG: tRNA-dihydrouridine synthase [Burkholderiaceae bacterium]|nr:tRNA-dihydrouridine synthase [Sulfuritalea sp.]MCF8175412.1 tRNA-dihydrouridine synthase [Burkholderiaceae bacterium]MCF8184375.1 tRNA-dihydrouridine synthase [Polynucleobacter sp.]
MSRIILAPMEGLADDVLRAVLTSAGGYDWCVTEFVRVTNTLLPHSCYTRFSPELNNGSRTASGTPVRIQLLGSEPTMLANNAAHLARLNPAGIDLNFGCPTPLVNRHRGGAALLDKPELLHSIASAVRRAVPTAIPVTAKMRLGIEDTHRALDCALALEAGGADELVVHARTKADGYRPLVRWEHVARIRQVVKLPLIANGEVWTRADYRNICAATGCDDVMLGRGAVADPLLASRIRRDDTEHASAADWEMIKRLIVDFWTRVQLKLPAHQSPGRLKQWLGMMQRSYPQAEHLYRGIREIRHATEISVALQRHGLDLGSGRPQPG